MADPNELRAQMILKDIYARHGISPDMPLEQQVAAIEEGMAEKGYGQAGWSNPEEKAQARLAYAQKGKTDQERRDRWDKSAYLLDPHSYQYQQGGGRDIDFLTAMHKASFLDDGQRASAARAAGGGFSHTPTRGSARDEALAFWDKSNFQPVYRDSSFTPNYQSESGFLMGLLDATTNPDLTTGQYLQASEVVPNRLRFSGEASTADEAYEGARAIQMANNRFRPTSKAPVLDLPTGSDFATKAERLSQLQEELAKASMPSPDQRWAKWTKDTFGRSFVPPGFVVDGIDFLTSAADPTALIPAGGAAIGAARVGTKGASVAGKGWVRPLLSNLAKSSGKEFGKDSAVEQGIGHTLSAGGDRTPSQYWLGDWSGNGAQRTPEQIQEARDARSRLYESLIDDDSISTANKKAYGELGVTRNPHRHTNP